MSEIMVTPLGAGQDVGRSCIIVQMEGKRILLDCGIHMGVQDETRFPDFSFITADEPVTKYINCVLISHFHLDHCGALPYLTEMVGYNGPIYMSQPTKAIAPILLEDMRKNCVERKGDTNFFTSQMIKDCMKKVITVNLHQNVKVDNDIEIKAYYAGHVIGAVMFYVRVGSQSIVYTGDYNMTPDRHLGAAWIDKCHPDILITESTYATTIRDSKRCRERDFLKKVHECVDRGGKVLIPVFALGRAQEICILLETYWERMDLKVPMFFAAGLTEKGNNYYKMFITWTNQKIKKTFVDRNMFEFKHIKPFDKNYVNNPGAMVVLASPGMLHGGLSLHIFRKWAHSDNNLLIMPGYCVKGTVGAKVLDGAKRIEIDKQTIDVKIKVEYMSFSAHADAKGIMRLIQYCEPRNVLLVHGEATKMMFLKKKIKEECNLECYMPANGETCILQMRHPVPIDATNTLIKSEALKYQKQQLELDPPNKRQRVIHGVLVMNKNSMTLMDVDDACKEAGIKRHTIRFSAHLQIHLSGPSVKTSEKLLKTLRDRLDKSWDLHLADNLISVESVVVDVSGEDEIKSVAVSWANEDDLLGSEILDILRNLNIALK